MSSVRARKAKSWLFTAFTVAISIAVVGVIAHILLSVALNGGRAILEAGISFFTEPPPPPGSSTPGGIGPALLGTLWLALLSSLMGIPLAVLTAVFLSEFKDSRIARIVRTFTNSLLEIPTVLVGMLVYVMVVVPTGGYSMLAGAIALSIVLLPYTATYVERALESVPQIYKEAGYALGMKRAQVVWLVSLRVARRGVTAGVLIGLAKALGETAPLLFTIGGALNKAPLTPAGLLEPGNAIPMLIFTFALSPYSNWHDVAWGAALVLVALVLAVIAASRVTVREVKV